MRERRSKPRKPKPPAQDGTMDLFAQDLAQEIQRRMEQSDQRERITGAAMGGGGGVSAVEEIGAPTVTQKQTEEEALDELQRLNDSKQGTEIEALLTQEEAVIDASLSPVPMQQELDVLPARMLNEFVYCARLFYYEHVEGIFLDSADTKRGAVLHKRVDAGNGAMPDAAKPKTKDTAEVGEKTEDDFKAESNAQAAEADTIHARSVMLSSERLGVIAKMDLVETVMDGVGGAALVCPVDYKAGSPRPGENGLELWDTDRMQLGLQCLVLRENGYACNQGLIYYRGTKQRVPLDITPELESWILGRIAAARETMRGPIPPPLRGSPKCVRCSLAPVCLPDETRMLGEAGRAANPPSQIPNPQLCPPRRLIASRDDTRVLYLNEPGLRVGRKDELLVIKDGRASDGEGTKDKFVDQIRINDLSHVSLFGNIQLSTQAIQILCEQEIPITYFSAGGWFYGITRGHEMKNIFTRMEQFRLSADPVTCLALARRFVNGKIRNHRTMLMRLHVEPPASIVAKLKTMADSALEAKSLSELLGTEGAAANFYFSCLQGLIKTAEDDDIPGLEAAPKSNTAPAFNFNFLGRNRRPPTDPVNALLSLAYSVLAKDCTLAALAVGLDPYVGFYHQPRFGRPALALDMMEEFRPIIAESAVLTCINNRMITPKHFVKAGNAVNLTPAGRKLFFQAYEQRMSAVITHPIFDYKVSYRRVLELQFRLLARYLTGEIPEYPPFLTR